jgi:hypothetical protein
MDALTFVQQQTDIFHDESANDGTEEFTCSSQLALEAMSFGWREESVGRRFRLRA